MKDITLIRSLAQEIWPKTYAPILSQRQIDYMMKLMYSEKALNDQMRHNHQFILVFNNGIPVGFAAFGEIEPTVYKLYKIYVLHSQQGKGAGKFVINYIINQVKAKGGSAIQLNVNRHNTAKLFYEKLGFVEIREEDIDIGGGYFMNDYIMEKRLGSVELIVTPKLKPETLKPGS